MQLTVMLLLIGSEKLAESMPLGSMTSISGTFSAMLVREASPSSVITRRSLAGTYSFVTEPFATWNMPPSPMKVTPAPMAVLLALTAERAISAAPASSVRGTSMFCT